MSSDYVPPRTFGDFLKPQYDRVWNQRKGGYSFGASFNQCRFCKADNFDKPLASYGLRSNICRDCIVPRADVVLPSIRKRERFNAKMRALHEGAVTGTDQRATAKLIAGLKRTQE